MNALELKNVCKTYPGFRLDDLTLMLPEGCILGLIGENGAGKSTTIRLILNMIRKDGGDISVLGKEIVKDTDLPKEDIGVVLDEVGIPECLTISQIENVMKNVFRNWDSREFHRITAKFSLPDGKPFKDFSRGMKMKTGIAVALSHHAKLLILDEATGGLDPVARDEVVEMLNDFTRDETHSILISSHIVSDLEKLCDYVAFLHKGKLMLCEEKDVLKDRYGSVRMTAEDADRLDRSAVLFRKDTPYGTELIVRRDLVPADAEITPVGIEELFVVMAKENQ